MLFFLVLALKLPFIKQNTDIQDDDYQRLTYGVTGKFDNQDYINFHKIETSSFSYESSGDRDKNPISNAFDDKDNTYWVSSQPESETFNPSIVINFYSTILFEGFTYKAAIRKLDNVKHFDGFPAKLKLYSANEDNDPFVLKAVFTGTQMDSNDNVQFILSEAISCKKIKLEFHDVSVASSLSSNEKLAAASNFVLFQSFGYEVKYHQKATGWYTNGNYIDSHTIRNFASYTNGDRDGYIMNNSINSESQWISSQVQNNDFTPTIYIDFTEPLLFEGFLFKVSKHKSGLKTVYDGFPNIFILSSALDDNDEYIPHTKFTGDRDGETIQFILTNPVRCKRIKIEMLDVHKFRDEGNYASTNGITILRSFEHKLVDYQTASGNYETGSSYIDFHLIPKSDFSIRTNGDREGNSIDLVLDNSDDTTWISKDQENSTFHPTIYVDFKEPTLFEALIYVVTSKKKTGGRDYFGYPEQLLVYTALDDEPLTPNIMFQGSPSDTHLQFVMPKPVNCTKIAFEFYYVHEIKGGGNYASADGLQFLRSFNYDIINYEAVTGNYKESNYIDFHLIPKSDFSIRTNGDREGNSIDLVLDNSDDTTWISKDQENSTFHPTIYVDFKEPTLFEALIYVVTSEKKTGGRNYFGYPEQLLVYTALDDEPLTPNIMFQGSPSDTHLQFVMPEPVNCTKIAFEFYYVHEIKNGGKYASADGLQFLRSYNGDGVKFEQISGKYFDKVFVDQHKVPNDKIKYSCNSEKTDHPLKDVFTDNSKEYWVSANDNSDDFKASIYINFTEHVLLEAIIINSTHSTKDNNVDFDGFPLRLNVYSCIDDGPLVLKTKFAECPLAQWKPDILFIFPTPIMCTYIQLEFVQITSNSFSNDEMKASIAGLIFVSQDPIIYENTNFTGDLDVIVANDKLYYDDVSHSTFVDYVLPKEDSYLFVIEKKFSFYNDSFICDHHKVGAIQSKSMTAPIITVEKCVFSSCTVKTADENGGAINFINCGIKCQTSSFTNCVSTTGGKGGAIYLHINTSISNDALIEKCTFTGCTAYYGGGLFIYSNDESKSVTVKSCTFEQNSVIESESREQSSSGSAIYLMTKKSVILRCRFVQNKGKDSLCIIYNFDKEVENNHLVSLSKKSNSVLVEDCLFRIDPESKSSISLLHDSKSRKSILIKNCMFEGKLENEFHHISGNIKNDLKMVKIVSCNFESGRKGAVNLKSENSAYSLDSGNQKNLIQFAAVILGAVVAISVIVALIIKIRKNSTNDDANTNEL